ncbi:malignant fibrous histiocytoma-amplified sequence 1 [Trichomycterus rosablanca]|uniref:malignant fibrous histiocytoma-amplified sequence 1 n=1 Tax=Trichomycterus rosablanca TaxID=2290929 RepID=UPI002F35A706
MASSNGYSNGRKDENYSSRKLKSLPKELLQKGQNVYKLNLEKNRLKNIPEISRLPNLTELNLTRNEFAEFPVAIGELKHLVKLYINQNNIKSIPENIFPSLKKLQFLKMSTNRLDKLPQDIKTCESLTYLNLSNNNLKDLEPLVGLCGLKELYVEKNRLKVLPSSLFESQCLEKIKANGNPLRMPPEEVCAGGLKEIQNYFDMLKASSYTVCTVKTMFLGSTMAGKSTLSRSLKLGEPVAVDEADRTVGIEISEVERDGIQFRFWDFAGQEEYYLTHHAFITPQAFVILAIDLSTYDTENPESFKTKVRFWISNIQLKVPNAVVLLVGTHIDDCNEMEVQVKKEDIESKVKQMVSDRNYTLEQRKQNLEGNSDQANDIEQLVENQLTVLDLIPIDCTNSEDIRKLQEHISNFLNKKESPFKEETLPQYYKDVEIVIQEMLNQEDIPKHGITNQEEILHHFRESFVNSELDHEKLQSILKYLHRIGVIMWYMEIPALKDMVFVKPSFLISLFKAIVRHDLVSKMEAFSKKVLISEKALHKHRDVWIEDYMKRATLSNKAIRILMHKELEDLDIDDRDLTEEIVGTDETAGNILTLLQHFEVCLPTKQTAKLNPGAAEFCPNTKWEPKNVSMYEPNGACLFPNKLETTKEVTNMWGVDNLEDIHVHVYFSPEMPHGLFHRLVIRICSIYSTYWIEKDLCLFSCGNRRVLLKNHADAVDQFIEIRSKDSDLNTSKDIQKAWDMIKVIMTRLNELLQQWRGLYSYVHSPCRERGCSLFFEWDDWQEWLDPNTPTKFNMDPEEKITCPNGHTRRTELLFPVGI